MEVKDKDQRKDDVPVVEIKPKVLSQEFAYHAGSNHGTPMHTIESGQEPPSVRLFLKIKDIQLHLLSSHKRKQNKCLVSRCRSIGTSKHILGQVIPSSWNNFVLIVSNYNCPLIHPEKTTWPNWKKMA